MGAMQVMSYDVLETMWPILWNCFIISVDTLKKMRGWTAGS